MTLVSVVIPCFNQGKYLRECLNSVMQQTYPNIEIVIVNDGSTDLTTLKELKRAESIPNIKIYNIRNSGVCNARNFGVNHSSGEYIIPLDGDDKFAPTYVEKSVNILNSGKYDIVYCIGRCFGDEKRLLAYEDFSIKQMLKSNVVFCSAMYKRKNYIDVGGYNPNMIYGIEDWDFWLSLIEQGMKFYRINEVLFFYRKKKDSRHHEYVKGKEDKKLLMIKQLIDNHKDLYNEYGVTIDMLTNNYTKSHYVNKLIRKYYNLKILTINKWKLYVSLIKNNL